MKTHRSDPKDCVVDLVFPEAIHSLKIRIFRAYISRESAFRQENPAVHHNHDMTTPGDLMVGCGVLLLFVKNMTPKVKSRDLSPVPVVFSLACSERDIILGLNVMRYD